MRVDGLPSRIVVDASLGLKWVFEEEYSDLATEVASGRTLLTTALFWAEVASRIRRGELDRSEGTAAFRDLQAARLVTRPLDAAAADAALSIANELRHPIYDCCYLALGIAENAPVITADRRFSTAVSRLPKLAASVILINDITF